MSYRKILGSSALLLTLAAPTAAQADSMAPGVYGQHWSGFYVGGHVGGFWGDSETDFEGGQSTDIDGFIGGGQVGFNAQNGRWVYGIEGDVSFSGADGSYFLNNPNDPFDIEWLATIRGRIGITNSPTLYYLTGGIAFAGAEMEAGPGNTSSNTHTGFVIGGGVEHLFRDNVSGKIEYNYISLGDEDYFDGEVPNTDIDGHVLKFGVNWHFMTR